jgi:gas vesicle protein
MANSSKSAVAFLIGAAIGAGLGILLAPDKGSNTRDKLKTGFDDKKEDLKNKFGDLSQKLNLKLDTSKADLESTFDDLAANVDEKTQDVISTLEKKLAELKKAASTLNK